MAFEPAKIYQNALKQADIPYTAFSVDDIDSEYQRLVDLGVVFLNPPKEVEGYKIAMLDDTCGNYIQLLQKL